MTNMNNSFFKPDSVRRTLPEYAQVYFDHLFSEYLKLAGNITDKSVLEQIKVIKENRQEKNLTWNDVYTLDLIILDYLPAEDLVRKAYDMRSKYRSIAGSKDYDAYIASKPPDLTSLQLEAISSPPTAAAISIEVLRADIRYLLGQFYLYYSLMPFREGLREELTRRARNWTFIFLGIIAAVVVLGFTIEKASSDKASSTVGAVVFAGIMGGCVSMLQRIQSAPSEGDALYNLATITNGWKGISLSPLYGAVFAVLLSVLFTARIVEGDVFPKIRSPRDNYRVVSVEPVSDATPNGAPAAPSTTAAPATSSATTAPAPSVTALNTSTPSASPLASASPTTSPTPSPDTSPTSSPTASPEATSSPANTQTAQASPSAPVSDAAGSSGGSSTSAKTPNSESVTFAQYLLHTGPATGKDYALLVIWSFIAGFAERLVPDTLNRLVTKNQSIQGTSS